MLAPLSRLKKYVDINMPVDQLVSTMIMSGTAVEGYEKVSPEISGVVVGRVLSVQKHTNADSLFVCQVDVGDKQLQICTAAKNLYPGALVPVATNGAHLAEGLKIKSTKMRGEASEGMFCSYQELGLPHEMYPTAAEDGIMIFNEEYPLGSDVNDIFGLNDIVIDFDILSNRPDCQSVYGVSREVSAALHAPHRDAKPEVKTCGGNVNDYIQVEVHNSELCPRFTCRIVKNVKIGPSPMWLRKALFAVGIRPINNVVDVTNYIMSEFGQPMHAYDLSDVRGAKIIVRNAKAGEVLRTLDGKDRELDPSMLVIADGEGVTGLAGVMGGENSEIKDTTTTVALEAASFDFASVRVTARKLGMRTDASSLFEKGVNAAMVGACMDHAAALIAELGCGEIVEGMIDLYPHPVSPVEIRAQAGKLHTLMGVDVPVEEMVKILNDLHIQTHAEGDTIVAVSPIYRTDISTPADLAEEVLRMYGYDKLPSVLMEGKTMSGAIGEKHAFQYGLRELLTGAGYSEAMTYSFVSPKVYDAVKLSSDDPRRSCAKILNPLGEDYSVMRTTLVPSMLQVLATNYSRKLESCRMFEMAPVFKPHQVPITELPDEISSLCLGAYGPEVDFFTIKGIMELIFRQYRIAVTLERSDEPFLHPGRSARVLLDGEPIGDFGQVHPDVCKNYKLGECMVGQLNLKKIMEAAHPLEQAKAPAKYQAVIRDIALVMDEATPAGDVMNTIKMACGKLFDTVSLFDVYRGKGIDEGKKSVAYKFSLQAGDRTLTDEEINKVWNKVLVLCERNHGAVLRG